jgi:hypothetical protein
MADTRTSPVRYFVPETPQFTRNLRQKLADERTKLAEQVASGIALDFAVYKERCGVIKGIDIALKLCTEIEQDLRD